MTLRAMASSNLRGWRASEPDTPEPMKGRGRTRRDPSRALSRILLAGALALPPLSPVAAQVPEFTPEQYAEDFDALWQFVQQTYVYFDPATHRWETVQQRHAARLREVTTVREFVSFLESILEELRDHHAHLNTNTASSPNLVPSRSDLWGEWIQDRAVVTQVRPGSEAEAAGIMAGMEVLTVDGVPVAEAVRRRLGGPRAPATPRALQWGLNAVLAGHRNQERHIGLAQDGAQFAVVLLTPGSPERGGLLDHARLEGNFGYIRIRDSLGNLDLIPAFDAAMGSLQETNGLVLDLRETPGGGNTAVARGIMGRLIETTAAYQMHSIPAPPGAGGLEVPRTWIEMVSPRGPFAYTAPVVVLVSRWTGSMGEGIAIGLDGMDRATVVGTPMAGLRGATYTFTLPNTGISATVPGELLFHLDGTPRDEFVPPVTVDLVRERAVPDPVLNTGIAALRERAAVSRPR